MDDERETLEPMVLVSRETWGAKPPKKKGENNLLPIPHVVVSFMAGAPMCETEEDCKKVVQELQKRHMADGLPDIPYSFVIGGDGQVYEGSGWRIKPCNPKFPEFKAGRLDIAYVGSFDRSELPWQMYQAALQLLNGGVETKLLEEEYGSTEDPDTAPELPF